jgi:phage terminase large subunit-like protein
VWRVVIDPNAGGEQLAQELEKRGFEVTAHPQEPSPMATAAERLYESVRSRRLRHPDHPDLNRHVLSAVRKTVGGERWRIVKSKRTRRPIDGAVALAMGCSVAVEPPERSVYEDRGLLSL